MVVRRIEMVDKHRPVIKDQARKITEADTPDLLRLAESMIAQGQLQPIGMVAADDTLGWGERRVLAARMTPKINMLSAVMLDTLITESEFRILQATENLNRQDLKPQEKSECAAEIKRLNPGMSNSELAELLHVDPSLLTRWLSPYLLIDPAKEAYFAGKFGCAAAYGISKLAPSDQPEALAMALAGASCSQLEAHGRAKRNGEAPAKHRVGADAGWGVGLTVSATDEIDLELICSAFKGALTVARRVKDKGGDVTEWKAAMAEIAKKKPKVEA